MPAYFRADDIRDLHGRRKTYISGAAVTLHSITNKIESLYGVTHHIGPVWLGMLGARTLPFITSIMSLRSLIRLGSR